MAGKQERGLRPVDLVLIQHAEGEDEVQPVHGGWLDTPLTPLGVRQAETLAERLVREGPALDALYASSLRRALETARIVGRALGLEPVCHDGLRAFNRGDLTGLTYEEAERRFPGAWNGRPDSHRRAAPNAETPVEFATRASRALEQVSAAHEGRRVGVVTHAGVIRAAVYRWLGLRPWSYPGVLLACEPASITRLRVTQDGLHEIVTVNDRAHLAGLGREAP